MGKNEQYVYISKTYDLLNGVELFESDDINLVYEYIEETNHNFESGVLITKNEWQKLKKTKLGVPLNIKKEMLEATKKK